MANLVYLCVEIYSIIIHLIVKNMSEEQFANRRTVNTEDSNLVVKTGLGCGVDITGNLGGNESVKTQILDYDLLVKNGLVEIDDSENIYNINRSGENYEKMTNTINSSLAGKIALGVKGLSFSYNLKSAFSKSTVQTDTFEYAENMIIRKMYALNIKPALFSHLRAFIPVVAWNEINATDPNLYSPIRTDKGRIKEVYKKYGTHVTTKTFYGCMYEYLMRREKNEWETDITTLLEMDIAAQAPIKGVDVDASKGIKFSDKDETCRKNSNVETAVRKAGGDTSVNDVNEWLSSCVKGENNNCALLGYSLGINSTDDSGLIPLYDLLDETDPRRQAMIDALQEYIDEYGFLAEQRRMVIVDAVAKRFSDGNAPEYLYENDCNGVHRKFFRLDEDIYHHVKGATHGKMYFYYALGHLSDNAVVDMKFCGNKDVNADWKLRGVNSNDGVTGCLNDRYLAIKLHNFHNYPNESEYVTGFGLKFDKNVKSSSKGTEAGFNWLCNPDCDDWYSGGLVHDDFKCVYTKDLLNNF